MAIRLSEEKLRNQGFSQDQIEEILQGLRDHCNVGFYLDTRFSGLQMYQIRRGLMDGLDVSVYCKPEYDWFQMEEIRKGLRDHLDLSLFSDPGIPYPKMRELRKGLRKGLDISKYSNYKPGVMRQYRKALEQGIHLDEELQAGFDADQLEQIRFSKAEGLPIEEYLDLEYSGAALQEIRRGLADGVDVKRYAGKYKDWRKMKEIRLGLNHQLRVELYDNPYYSWQQMHEIRLGLMQGLQAERYCQLVYPATEMRRIRIAMLAEMEQALQEKKARESVQEEDYSISFSEKNLEARFTYTKHKNYLTRALVHELLERNRVCYGILEEAIDEIVNNPAGCKDVLVAQGVAPQNGENGWFELFFRTNVEKKPKVLEDGSVDYRDLEWFETVEKGQKLAYYHGATAGVDGINVFGEPLKAANGIEKRVLVGNGFQLDGDRKTYYAAVSGKIELAENRMNITNHLRVEDVSLTTGNLEFNGSVHVLGNVEPGMTLDVAGDLVIDGNVAGATIRCGGAVVLKKGMNANGRGSIRAKGNVDSRYFEAVTVESDGDIRCNTALNCELYARGKIVSTTTVAGGSFCSEEGFQLKDVGNKAWIRTEISIVRDDSFFAAYSRAVQAQKDVSGEVETLEHHRGEMNRKMKERPESGGSSPSMDLLMKLEDAIFTKKEQLKTIRGEITVLNKQMKKLQLSKVAVRGTAFPGVIIRAGDSIFKANNEQFFTISGFDGSIS